jgi:hypothetical protein
MPRITTLAAATDELSRMTQATIAPVITDDLTGLLEAAVICTIWTATTTYKVGDVVIPTANNQNGKRYVCKSRSGGVQSGSTEPSWPTSDDATVSDGNLIWREDGPEPAEALWDLRHAAYHGWLLKAEKVAHKVNFSTDKQRVDLSKQHAQFLENADKYAPVILV